MSLNDVTGAIASAVAPEHRERFGRTFFGTLLGQALVLLGMLVAYVAALGLLFRNFRDDLSGLRDWAGETAFWGIVLAPLAVIFAFSLAPTAFQAWRERRLRSLTITEAARSPGQFRLHPYGPRDADQYTRPDHADDRAVDWLEAAEGTLLYLSGASGSGKSSLLAAAVLPRLQAAGWRCVTFRVYADPVAQFRDALLASKDLFAKPPAANTALPTLLERAAQERARVDAPPLLIVIDQFEEFLILNDDTARAPFIELLHALDATPIPRLRLLLVFRSDYRELLFKLGLPRYVSGQNAFELAPFMRSEAEGFLRGSGRVLAPEGYDALFAGLDRIEEARGLYRPITLNMVGLVLERMGGRVTGDPARLIEQYLKTCIAAGTSRDFAPPVLRDMITASGTKEPRDVASLAATTGLASWQVESTLADLDAQGLVRPLDAARSRWEISHDFLARQIGILLGRLRRPWLRRAAPLALAAAALGWAAAMFLLLVWWPGVQERRTLVDLRTIGIGEANTAVGEGLFLTDPNGFDDARLLRFAQLYEKLRDPPTNLTFAGAAGITSLEPLRDMPLTSLNLSATGISDLEPLRGMPLTWLSLGESFGITTLEPLKDMPLFSLDLSGDTGITDLEPLRGMPLTWLDLSNADGITSLEPLTGMPLTTLGLADADRITSLEPLGDLPLTWLDLSSAAGVTTLEPLERLSLISLNLSATSITSLEPLRGMPLTWLSLGETFGITTLEPLTGMALTSLDLSGDTGITSLEPLRGMPLTWLDLTNADGIDSVEPLKGMPLTMLSLGNAYGITSLAPLRGMNPGIVSGASDELLATMR